MKFEEYRRHDAISLAGLVAKREVTPEELLADYPYLEREDVLQALRYAAWRAEEREVALAGA